MTLLCGIVAVVAAILLGGCGDSRKNYVIGVSQCSEDSWRNKLISELRQSTYLHDDIELDIRLADDDVEQQRQQIQELIGRNVDLLIVSPQQTANLSGVIKEATDRSIPVILFDRKSDVDNYTAFMGTRQLLHRCDVGRVCGRTAGRQRLHRGDCGGARVVACRRAAPRVQRRHSQVSGA